MFKFEKIYSRRKDIHGKYGGHLYGGIATTNSKPYIFLFTSDGDGFLHNKDEPKKIFNFSGEGQIGDMTFTRGNRAILEHKKNKKELLVFNAASKGDYIFLGVFEYLTHEINQGIDYEGKPRNEIMFNLNQVRGDLCNQSLVFSHALQLRKGLSDEFARNIAHNPNYLDAIEWRELEYTIQLVLEELGFEATITPGSKDGGKDIVVECTIDKRKHTYFIEIKHWREQSKVGGRYLDEFLEVIINEKVDGGLFLSTSGYCNNVMSSITKIERGIMRMGGKDKIYSLCRHYSNSKSGILAPEGQLVDILFEDTM
ncbi:hypothetical protein ACX03_15730 [Vibrio parahaemolyticus]|nr:hypothetical protein ACX03_15730 [Vibrio parahaemolyticus]